MIPILYDKTETAFVSNGLGRLRDCISCIVTEERNGVYELDFEYPVSGANYDLIQVGRIVGVTHDETGDIQPFDIVSFKKPIDGIVEYHCVHISYRQAYMTATGSNINSLSDAFTLFGNATPANPFTYSTDKTSAGYLACADGTPRSVRQMLGGIEGSVLDAYGGEYEFDRWNVILHSSRGQLRNFTIRYGVNMLDYNEDYDATDCYSACVPYWTDGTTKVVGDKQTNTGVTPSGREQCIPLDVSDKFESQPTKAQVEAMGLSVMNSANPTLPARSIEISFVRLQDAGETAIYETLLQCRLCDTINVIFPDFNSTGQFKIVRTEWNVLRGKYETMELGSLSVSLAEALGIGNTLDRLPSETETTTPTISITASTGTLQGYTIRKYGNIIQLHVQVRKTTATASGSNVFVGTINTAALRPLMTTTTATYLGAYSLPATISPAGSITVRNATPNSLAAMTSNANVAFTYII